MTSSFTFGGIEIDVGSLPKRLLFDTGVFMRAIGIRADAKRGAACRALYEAALRHDRMILVAAPTITEIMRGEAAPEPPRARGVMVVPVDERAAICAGRWNIRVERTASANGGLGYLLYDTLIAACAERYGATYVTLDVRQKSHVGVPMRSPQEFVAKQVPMPLGEQPRA